MSQPAPVIQKLERQHPREKALPEFRAGDTVRVQVKIREGEKERLQAFEGVVTARAKTGSGTRASFTVRKVSYGVGVERKFLECSPNVASLDVLARGRVRQARLYYLRDLSGKAARIKERAYDRVKAAEEAAAEAAALGVTLKTKTQAKKDKKAKRSSGKAAGSSKKPGKAGSPE
jgi:large subunit ribosomal protein L19